MRESTIKQTIFENDTKTKLPTALGVASPSPPDNFNPGWRFYTSFTSLCIITLAVALDATSLSVALPVKDPFIQKSAKWKGSKH